MSYPLSPSELLIEQFSYEWIQHTKKHLLSLNLDSLLINKQIQLLDEIQNNCTRQFQIHKDATYGGMSTGRDESARHRSDYMRLYFVPCFKFVLKTILNMKDSLRFSKIYHTNINKVLNTTLQCEHLTHICPVIETLLQLSYFEKNEESTTIIKEIIKYIPLIKLQIYTENKIYKMCTNFQHGVRDKICECYYPKSNHPINTIVCERMLRNCCGSKCRRNNSIDNNFGDRRGSWDWCRFREQNYEAVDVKLMRKGKASGCGVNSCYNCDVNNCYSCGLDKKLHKIDHYCVCNIKKMDAQTLKLHYIKCMDSALTIDSMPSKYFTKYAITEALNNNVKIVVPLHEIKQSKPKKSISASLRQKVWNQHIGLSVGETLCKCCNTNIISQLRFHCGHVIAEACGGETTLENLRPICEKCNLSMGTQNLNDFAQTLL
jgi:hypothetical protein